MAGYKILGLANQKNPQEYKILGNSKPKTEEEELNESVEKLDNLPGERSFLSKLLPNALTGLTHQARNLANSPHDLLQQFENVTGKIGSVFDTLPGPKIKKPNALSPYLPNDTEDYSDVFGLDKENKTLSDKITQGAFEHAPELLSLGLGGRALLRKYPITQGGGARQLRQAEKLVKNRGIEVPISQEILEEAKPFLPKTHATRELLKDVGQGNYKSSFGLQSQVGKHERDLYKSPLAAERLLAPQARELKQRIVSHMETRLKELGHHDIADLLKGGLNDYRKYIQFRDKVKPYVKWLGVPTSAIGFLALGTNKGKKIINALSD